MQQRAELLAGHFVRIAAIILEHQQSALGADVVRTVSDVVDDVQLVWRPDDAVKLAHRGLSKPYQLDHVPVGQRTQGLLQLAALVSNIERGEAPGTANNAEDP